MTRPNDRDCDIVHASCVAHQGRAVLILGASGVGKSGLALRMMALGAGLVADDRTCLWVQDGKIMADAPETLRGQIEARFVGILNADAIGPCSVHLVVDMDTQENHRLPEEKSYRLLGVDVPLLHNVQAQHFAAAILQMLTAGRRA